MIVTFDEALDTILQLEDLWQAGARRLSDLGLKAADLDVDNPQHIGSDET